MQKSKPRAHAHTHTHHLSLSHTHTHTHVQIPAPDSDGELKVPPLPTVKIGGVEFSSAWDINEKGSVVEEDLIKHLEYLNVLREKLKCPDQWCVLLADGV